MNSELKYRKFKLSEETFDYINYESKKSQLSNSKMLDKIVSEHKKINENKTSELALEIVSEIEKKYTSLFNTLRVKTMITDLNVETMMEMMVALCVNNGALSLPTSAKEVEIFKKSRAKVNEERQINRTKYSSKKND